jgi:hypothetical protein
MLPIELRFVCLKPWPAVTNGQQGSISVRLGAEVLLQYPTCLLCSGPRAGHVHAQLA